MKIYGLFYNGVLLKCDLGSNGDSHDCDAVYQNISLNGDRLLFFESPFYAERALEIASQNGWYNGWTIDRNIDPKLVVVREFILEI